LPDRGCLQDAIYYQQHIVCYLLQCHSWQFRLESLLQCHFDSGLALNISDCCMCDEYQNHAYIDQFLHLIRLVSYCLYRLSHECPQEIVLPVDKAFKLIYANLGEQDVLHSEEAHEKPL